MTSKLIYFEFDVFFSNENLFRKAFFKKNFNSFKLHEDRLTEVLMGFQQNIK